MPQGRRKQPFSQKQKKIQLQLKREKRRDFLKSASFDRSAEDVDPESSKLSQSRSNLSYATAKLSQSSLIAGAGVGGFGGSRGALTSSIWNCGGDDEVGALGLDENGNSTSALVSSEDDSDDVSADYSEEEYGVTGISQTGSVDNLSSQSYYSKGVIVNRLNQQPASNTTTNSKKSGGGKKNSLSCFANALPSTSSRGYDPNKYRLHFAKESREEIDERKLDAQKRVLHMLPRESLEMSIDQVFGLDTSIKDDDEMESPLDEVPSPLMDMPKRPLWSYKLDKLQLERQEEKYFRDYITQFYARHNQRQQNMRVAQGQQQQSTPGLHGALGDNNLLTNHSTEQLSYFELNLETWRQLWRVLEMSDILLLICDVRHPVLHLPPSLYRHITKDLNKDVVVILNKIDLVSPEVSIAWKQYLQERFPKLHIVLYSTDPTNFRDPTDSYQSSANKSSNSSEKGEGEGVIGGRRRLDVSELGKIKTGRRKPTAKSNYVSPIGLQELVSSCEKCARGSKNKSLHSFDFSAWQYKVAKQMSHSYDYKEATMCAADQRLTIGCVGHPNVGKSSVINSIVGKKVVSTSRTPGHTKHFQTHFVTCNVQLCDCPGLVFPSIVDKQQQIFSGLFPIAQVQEPYTPVGFIADRLPLIEMLGLKHPQGEGEEWTAWDVCEAWAVKRGFRIAKTGRFDVYRAANHLLRLTVEGRICMATYPPNFFAEEEKWKKEEETKDLVNLVLRTKRDLENGAVVQSVEEERNKVGADVHHLAVDGDGATGGGGTTSDESRSMSPGRHSNSEQQNKIPSEEQQGAREKRKKKGERGEQGPSFSNKFSQLLDFSSD